MSSKTKKGKKKTKGFNDVTKSKDPTTNKKIQACFVNEEISELKTIMKTKDVVSEKFCLCSNCHHHLTQTSVPLVIAATVIYKFDLLKKLLKDGYNINQTGQNNMTALMWAVKYKHLDIVEYLLTNGCDPTIKTDSGDNVLILALEHKLWDEQEMIDLWNSVRRVSYIDVNFTNKNGHNMLHMCVRRDWEQLLKLFLAEKPNIDAGNSNGVTPLMLACFRNNINVIETLMNAGANILKEDNHGRMTLCYAISSVMKVNKPPFLATDRIIAQLKKNSSLETYLKRRLELIIATAKKPEISCATSEMLIKIVQFAVQFIEESISIFLECDVFVQLLEVLEKRLDNTSITKFLLLVCEEILFYNDQSLGWRLELYNKLLDSFYESGWVDMVLEILRRPLEESKIAFNLLILSLTNEERFGKIIEENKEMLLGFMNDSQPLTEDDTRIKILKNRRRRLKKFYDSLDIATLPVTDSSERVEEKKKSDASNCSKKSRRRSKAIKAKLTKIKSAELSKRLNLNGKKASQPKSPRINPTKTSPDSTIEVLMKPVDFQSENPIASSFHHLLEGQFDDGEKKTDTEDSPKWKQKIASLRNTYCKSFPMDGEKLHQAIDHLKNCNRSQKYDVTINKSVNVVVDYLRQLLQMLVRKYQEHWENDRMTGSCTCVDLNEHVPWLYGYHIKTLEVREKQIIQDVQKNFEHLVKTIKDLAHKDLNHCLEHLNKIESTILNYEIRGIKLISYISGMETFTLKYSTHNPTFDTKSVLQHVQNVLNDVEEPRNDIAIEITEETEDVSFVESYRSETPIELYYREMSLVGKPEPKNKRKEIEAKLNTIANGFHLINSIMSMCEESASSENDQAEEKNSKKKKKYTVSDLNYTLRNKCTKTLHCPDITEIMPKGLMSQISSLKQSKNFQRLLNGNIRTAVREKRNNYLISAGTNFAAAEIGLDVNDQTLAVRKVLKDSWFGKLLKTLVDPLLGLVHTHILHYFACDFDGEELILATPICKWNLAQYVQLLKQCNINAMPTRAIDIIRQFLDGLMVLHKCETPIVHGNLKPSNVFIDFSGIVKIGEFGLYKALYKIIEAPNSSLIWFAKETLHIYRNSSVMDCSIKSDVHVAGMLIYFVLSYGKHLFGEETQEILRNIKRGNAKLNTKNLDLKDLLSWMTLSDCNQRPTVEQVLSHPFFWSPSKKWSFILCCSGVNQTEYLINVDKLYRSIDTYSSGYLKIDWHDTIKSKFPTMEMTEHNTVIGLLKFIRNYQENQTEVNLTEPDLSCAILSLFPALPAGLYRTLQNTNWLKHAIFMQFSELF